MLSIESMKMISHYVFIIMTITTNVINLFACMTFIMEDYF